ncbi:MAG: hypothetical protein Q9195_000477 [Heterodermia aff. obscurata]
MMSGATGTNFNIMSNLVQDNTATVAKSVGCTHDDPNSQATLDCLRKAPFERLRDTSVDLARQLRPPFGELAFYPSYDGDYITNRPSVLLRKGLFVKGTLAFALNRGNIQSLTHTGISIIGSWVANDGAWYAPPSISDDASVLATFQTFIKGLSKPSLQRLLSLYPVSDFTRMVRPNETATADYYRAAQMNRDLWFTCPVIDFTWQYTRFGGYSNARLYDMNQTKFGPIFQYMGIPQWRVSHLSDIPYLMNEDVAAGGDNSPGQQELSAAFSGSITAFAHSGDPAISRGGTFKDWPIAYQDQTVEALSKEYPEELSLYVVGGTLGSGPARVSGTADIGSKSKREEALAWEKSFERCSFINSILEEIGV